MKQVLYDKKGNIFVEDVPVPACGKNEIIVKNMFSLLSTGTEKSMITLMKKPLFKMALERKDLTRQVLNFAKESGVRKTIDLVKSRLDVWHLLGYSSCGTVIKVGENIKHVGLGDKVACSGTGIANHAEFIVVPKNMFVKIPEGVKLEEGAFAGIGAIAMQSIRQANPTLGETHVVIGLGLIGQLAAQLLKANGCKVIGIDIDKDKIDKPYIDLGLTKSDVKEVMKFTNGNGTDGVIIAAATKADLVNPSFDMCRRRGRVVLLGVSNINIDRSKMYEKELDFKISTAFGPGYYDPEYEQKNIDYPIGYVRWTMNRNMESFLQLIKDKKIDTAGLIDETYEISKVKEAYKKMFESKSMGILIRYENHKDVDQDLIILDKSSTVTGSVKIGLIGAGNFTKGFLIPAIKRITDLQIYAVATKSGSSCKKIAKELKAKYATTDYKRILNDKKIDIVMICTRHDTHAQIAIDAIKAGKHVYVEKPAAIFEKEFLKLRKEVKKSKKIFAVGFNRRYSPTIKRISKQIKRDKPIIINYIFNNTYLPENHWVNQRDVGGGRIIGEACHIIDLFNFLTGSKPRRIFAEKITSTSGEINDDNNVISTIKYEDGSVCNLVFSCIGSEKVQRERCEIFQDGNVFEMIDFKEVKLNGKKIMTSKSDLGYFHEMLEIKNALKGLPNTLLTSEESILATEATFGIVRSIKG